MPRSGYLYEICTQTDWKVRKTSWLSVFVFLFIIVVKDTWIFYTNYSLIPFLYPSSAKSDEAWQELHLDCLNSLCEVAKTIQFHCKVDETGESAHVVVFESETKHSFPSEISIPEACFAAARETLGKEYYDKLQSYALSKFHVQTVNLFHYYETDQMMNEEADQPSRSAKKAILQLLPGQCAVWEIFQQSWYEWYGDSEGDPPPPVSLINFSTVEPGQVVHVKTIDFLQEMCPYDENKRLARWYNMIMGNRHASLLLLSFIIRFSTESVRSVGMIIQLVPLTLCISGLSSNHNEDDDQNRQKIWAVLVQLLTIWRALFSLCTIARLTSGGENIYIICALSGCSMFFCENSRAAIEWVFLHAISYIPIADLDSMIDSMTVLDDLLTIIVPVPGLLRKIVFGYMLFTSYIQEQC